jgi:hypothetical protein
MNVDEYMNDLFGEADNVTQQIATAAPVVKGLAQRLDDLASINCCRREISGELLISYPHANYLHSKIAWSRFGCIANIAADGRRVDLRVLIRDPKTGEWRLQRPTSVSQLHAKCRRKTTCVSARSDKPYSYGLLYQTPTSWFTCLSAPWATTSQPWTLQDESCYTRLASRSLRWFWCTPVTTKATMT